VSVEQVYVALGSNLGDRAAHLAFARHEIARLPNTRVVAATDVEETAPHGPVEQGPFLNQMLLVQTSLEPEALLAALHDVERRAGRDRAREVRWGPRPLDCDIVRYGERAISTPRLTLPHPGIPSRDWWRRELAALGSDPVTDTSSRPTMSHDVHLALPAWAQVGEKRLAHIKRVTTLLAQWAPVIACDEGEAAAMRDAGAWHDALRDAPEALLRELTGDRESPTELLHGPAAAVMLERDGEQRTEVLEAVRWHTIGSAGWGRVGRALYVADFLEPGRKFAATDRAFLAALVGRDFDGVLRQVVRMRIEWSLREGLEIFPETASFWNSVR